MIPQSEFGDLVGIVVDMRREIAQLKRELANMVKVGTVSDVDAKKGYRLDFGQDENGQPKKSAWLPHPESGGAAKSWIPLSVGQTAAMVTPPGDTRQGFLVRGGFSDQNPQPSENTNENVFTFGQVKIEIRDAEVIVSLGGTSLTMTPSKAVIKAESIFGIGKTAMGVDGEEFPLRVVTVAGPAKQLFSKV